MLGFILLLQRVFCGFVFLGYHLFNWEQVISSIPWAAVHLSFLNVLEAFASKHDLS